jgi:hypothetical protein
LKTLEDTLKEQKEKENNIKLKELLDHAEKTKNDLKSKGEKVIGEILITIVFMLFTLVIIGLPTLFKDSFDWEKFKTIEFWREYLMIQFATWFTRIWIVIVRYRMNKKNNKEWHKISKRIEEYVEKDQEKPFINKHSLIDNKERKIRAFINNQKIKIFRLSKRFKVLNVIDYLHHMETYQNSIQEEFCIVTSIKYQPELENASKLKKTMFYVFKWLLYKVRKLRIKKAELKLRYLFSTIQNSYIEKNIDNIKVRYNKVDRNILVSGFSQSRDSNVHGYSYHEDSVGEFLRATLPMFLFVSAVTFLILPLSLKPIKDAESWYKFGTNVFLVFVSASMMWFKADDLFEKTKLRVLIEREDTLNNYYKKEKSTLN